MCSSNAFSNRCCLLSIPKKIFLTFSAETAFSRAQTSLYTLWIAAFVVSSKAFISEDSVLFPVAFPSLTFQSLGSISFFIPKRASFPSIVILQYTGTLPFFFCLSLFRKKRTLNVLLIRFIFIVVKLNSPSKNERFAGWTIAVGYRSKTAISAFLLSPFCLHKKGVRFRAASLSHNGYFMAFFV